MNIVIDAFGGDNAPLEVIKGSIDAQKDFGVDVTLVGDEEKIKKCAQENGLDITALHIKHADTVIEICEEPTEVIKGKKDCSMADGMKMLADGDGRRFRFSWLNRRTCSWSNVYRKENKGNQKTSSCNNTSYGNDAYDAS